MIVTVRRATFVIAAGVAMAACARIPTGPSVMVLAGSGKPLEQFQTDDRACRQSAAQEIESAKRGELPAQRRYDMAYMQCMYAKGHQIPVPGGRPGYTSQSSAGSPAPAPSHAPSASPPTSARAECERRGGVWRAAVASCEYQAPGSPTPVR